MSETEADAPGVLSRTVTKADTASAWGEEFPPAASTPFVLGLAEVACHRLVADDLADEEVTVGTEATVEHLAPSGVGATLSAAARLVARDGRRMTFEIEVFDGATLAARLTHKRAVVQRARIESRLQG